MTSNPTDTIIAPASALGGGVAVIRVSGGSSGEVYCRLTGKVLPEPRWAQLVTLTDPATGKMLDKAVALYFAGPHSFTGEDVLELHVHGGKAVVESVLRAALALDPMIRLAENGEFSKRAYLNGKIDLTAAEAIADLVAAETQAQAELALAQMGGALSDLYEGWRQRLTRILAYFEAAIDFVDEEDVPADLLRDTGQKIAALRAEMAAHLEDQSLGERLREGFVVAVIGAPNAGKSSLVNALAKREVAIVTPHAGTTRDVLEVPLNLGGYPVIVMDTAGLRATTDEIEAEGIARARHRAAHADLVLALFDSTRPEDAETLGHVDERTLVVYTKSDLKKFTSPLAGEAGARAPAWDGEGAMQVAMTGCSTPSPQPSPAGGEGALAISVANGCNLDRLIQAITAAIHRRAGSKPAMPLLTRARHREAVTEAAAHLQRTNGNAQPELLAEDLRLATRALGRITGRVDVEDLLEIIFRDFCIGK